MKQSIKRQMADALDIKKRIDDDEGFLDELLRLCEAVVRVYRDNGKIIIAGNGGSAADAQHIACELVGRFEMERPALPAISLSTDTSVLTAVSNDYGYDALFSRQLEAHGRKGDLFIGLSTSGNSENVLTALKKARELHMGTAGFTGASGGKMEGLCDYLIRVPSGETPRIQEVHIMLGHILCAVVEEELFGNEGG